MRIRPSPATPMPTEDFEFLLTTTEDAHVIGNLFPFYLHDVCEYDAKPTNTHGVYLEDQDIKSWTEFNEKQVSWWQKPDVLFPYLTRVGGIPAGFNMVAGGPYVLTKGIDFTVYEFFIQRAFRGTDVALRTAQEGIARHRGTWEVVTYPSAPRAIAFWRKVIPLCASGEVVETEEKDHHLGHKILWRFDNRS